jgi:hypothetical protein
MLRSFLLFLEERSNIFLCSREYRMKPLMGAEPYFFCLDTKETKNQDKKILPPTGKTPRPALFVGHLPTFIRGHSKICHCCKDLSFPSVERLRAKAGKTMVATSVMAGHSRFLQKGKGNVRSDSRVKI